MSAYLDGWKRAFSFSGKSTRAQFWVFNIINALLVYLIYAFMLADLMANGDSGELSGVLSLFLLVFTIPYLIASWTIAVRRLHDSGKSGWCLLLGFIPLVGAIILFIFYLLPSE